MVIEKDELNIYDVEELHKELTTAFGNGDYIVDMTYIEKVDMSVIQLFISAYKSAQEISKVFELQNVSKKVHTILKLSACEFLAGGTDG